MFSSTELQLKPYTKTSGWSRGGLQKLLPSGLMMANTQKLIILPKDYHSTFRVCNSPFFRSVQLCLGFQSMSRFLLFLTTLLNNGQELQLSHWALNSFPSEVEGNCQDSFLCSGGDPTRCLTFMQSAQLHWLTERACSKFCRSIHPEESVGFRASPCHWGFGNRFK